MSVKNLSEPLNRPPAVDSSTDRQMTSYVELEVPVINQEKNVKTLSRPKRIEKTVSTVPRVSYLCLN